MPARNPLRQQGGSLSSRAFAAGQLNTGHLNPWGTDPIPFRSGHATPAPRQTQFPKPQMPGHGDRAGGGGRGGGGGGLGKLLSGLFGGGGSRRGRKGGRYSWAREKFMLQLQEKRRSEELLAKWMNSPTPGLEQPTPQQATPQSGRSDIDGALEGIIQDAQSPFNAPLQKGPISEDDPTLRIELTDDIDVEQ